MFFFRVSLADKGNLEHKFLRVLDALKTKSEDFNKVQISRKKLLRVFFVTIVFKKSIPCIVFYFSISLTYVNFL